MCRELLESFVKEEWVKEVDINPFPIRFMVLRTLNYIYQKGLIGEKRGGYWKEKKEEKKEEKKHFTKDFEKRFE